MESIWMVIANKMVAIMGRGIERIRSRGLFSNFADQRMKDPVRQKHIVETPEERVRQAVIRLFMEGMGVPRSLLGVERSILIHNEIRRPDLIVHDRNGAAWMVVECKAPGVTINQDTLNQVANYNRVLKAPFLLVTNGTDHLCARIQGSSIMFLEELPNWVK